MIKTKIKVQLNYNHFYLCHQFKSHYISFCFKFAFIRQVEYNLKKKLWRLTEVRRREIGSGFININPHHIPQWLSGRSNERQLQCSPLAWWTKLQQVQRWQGHLSVGHNLPFQPAKKMLTIKYFEKNVKSWAPSVNWS